jgi:hypothetical protein
MAKDNTPAQLDSLIRLTALQVIGDRTGVEAIALLGRAGLDNELIAEVVGTTPATVRAALSRARRKSDSARSSKKQTSRTE